MHKHQNNIQHNINFVFFEKYLLLSLLEVDKNMSLAPIFSHFIGDERIGDFLKCAK